MHRHSSQIRPRIVRHNRRDATGFTEHGVGGRRIPRVAGRTEQQREVSPGAVAEDANAVGIHAVLLRMLADEADRSPHVRHDRRQGIPRPAAVSHNEDGESLLVQRGEVWAKTWSSSTLDCHWPLTMAMTPAPLGRAGRYTSSMSASPSSLYPYTTSVVTAG